MFFIHVSHGDDEYSLGQCGRVNKLISGDVEVTKYWQNAKLQKKGVIESVDLQEGIVEMWTCTKCSNAKMLRRRS